MFGFQVVLSVLTIELSKYQAYLIVGPKNTKALSISYILITGVGYIAGATLYFITSHYVSAVLILVFFTFNALLILSLNPEVQEHPEFIDIVSQSAVRPLKFPYQVRQESRNDLLNFSFDDVPK